MMCDGRLFGPQIALLSANCSIQVAAVSQRWTIGEMAADILASAPPHFALAGLSMGGIIAMEVWRQAPERVTRLALLDTNPRAEVEAVAQGRAAQIARAQNGELAQMMRDSFIPKYVDQPGDHPKIVHTCLQMASALGPVAFEHQSIALRDRPDQCEALKAVNVPTLILCGENDRLCPIERHELLHALIGPSTLSIIPGVGHLSTLQAPHETNAALKEWLEV